MAFPNTFATKEQMANLAAKMFLEIEAVKFRPEEPYTFASGLASPVYIDCRKLISHPRIRSALMDFAVATRVSGSPACARARKWDPVFQKTRNQRQIQRCFRLVNY